MKLITKGRVIGALVIVGLAGLLWGGYKLQMKIGAPDDKPRYKTAEVDRGSFHAAAAEPREETDGPVIEGEYERLSEKPLRQGRSVQQRRYRS